MENTGKHDLEPIGNEQYFGKILTGDYTRELKGRVADCIAGFREVEQTGIALIHYIAAWRESDKQIWYEFVPGRLLRILNCKYTDDVAEIFRSRVLDRRIYKYHDLTTEISRKVIDRDQLNGARDILREETEKTGIVEAVYKISRGDDGKPIWLKDRATVEAHQPDNVFLSLGNLTVVTKEMEVEEERERLVHELRKALGEVKTLSGLLPICSSCNKIRDDTGYWTQLDDYIIRHPDAEFSICPECFKKEIEEFDSL